MIGKENPIRFADCFGMASDGSDDLFSSLRYLNRAPCILIIERL